MIVVKVVDEFNLSEGPVIDVRSPGEYDADHIPGALNVPLLSNKHRHHVGVVYKMGGQEAAIALGHKLVDPLREQILENLAGQVTTNVIRVYCARGGLRSQLMSKFFSENGYKVTMLFGGYKAYRQHAISTYQKFEHIVVLSGYTGSGKTEILKELSVLGEQVLDLEALAEHRGSAFGALGQQSQPTSTQFHNRIYEVLRRMDAKRRLWVESESITVGKVYIPEEFWRKMKQAPAIEIELPIEERVKHTLEIYGQYDLDDLSACIKQLRRRLGDQEMRLLCALTEIGDLEPVVVQLLKYYDKGYELSKSKRECQDIVKLPFAKLKPRKIAEFLKTYELKNDKFA